MKVMFFDCFSGISGDMTIGALLDLGVDFNELDRKLSALGLSEFAVMAEKKASKGIMGTKFDVKVHEYVHHHDENHSHHHHSHGRSFADIKKIINNSKLSSRVKTMSLDIFNEIAKAEAKVHGKDIDEVHFHEVGAVDSIVDIVGTAICLDILKVDKIYSSPLHLGQGVTNCAHGEIPVPVPAVVEMLKGSQIPIQQETTPFELVTPTGMGIIKTVASSFGVMPKINVEAIGYGLGTRDIGKLNALRVFIGEINENVYLSNMNYFTDEIAILETNIDSMTPEALGFAMDSFIKNGALDVSYKSIHMKKNRPGIELSLMCKKDDEEKMLELIFKNTNTIGIRKRVNERVCLKRESGSAKTTYGDIRYKKITGKNIDKDIYEYDDICRVAIENNLSYSQAIDKISEDIGNGI